MALQITSISQSLNEAPMGPLHWKIFTFAAMGIFIDGYDFFIIAAALPVINDAWHPAPAILGLIGASATVGAIAGAALLGRYADLWGRRTMAIATMSAFAILSLVSAFSWDALSLILFRFILGAWIGADYPTGAAYVAEFMPLRRRSRLLFASLSFQAIGAIAGACIGLAFLSAHNVHAWRWMLGFGCLPAILILILRRQLPESPRWLYNDGRIAEAKSVMERLLQRPVTFSLLPEDEKPPLAYGVLFSRRFIKRVILACVPWFTMDIGLYGMALFTPIILASTAFSGGTESFWNRDIKAMQGAIALDFVLLAGFVIGIWAVGVAGLYRMQMIGFGGMVVGLVVVSLASTIDNTFLIFAGFGIFNLFVNAGPNGTTYMVPPIVFPTEIRASGSGLATAAGKVGASIGIFFMPVMNHAWGLAATVLAVAVVAFAGLATTALLRGELSDELHHEPGRLVFHPQTP